MKFASLVSECLRRSAYRSKTSTLLINELRSSTCVVEKTIEPDRKGRVKTLGSWWSATSCEKTKITKGQMVRVVGIEGITLLVRLANRS